MYEYVHMIRSGSRLYTIQSCCNAVAVELLVEIDVAEIMKRPAEKTDHSPKYRFAASSTLDRAVYRLADEQRATY